MTSLFISCVGADFEYINTLVEDVDSERATYLPLSQEVGGINMVGFIVPLIPFPNFGSSTYKIYAKSMKSPCPQVIHNHLEYSPENPYPGPNWVNYCKYPIKINEGDSVGIFVPDTASSHYLDTTFYHYQTVFINSGIYDIDH